MIRNSPNATGENVKLKSLKITAENGKRNKT